MSSLKVRVWGSGGWRLPVNRPRAVVDSRRRLAIQPRGQLIGSWKAVDRCPCDRAGGEGMAGVMHPPFCIETCSGGSGRRTHN